MEQVFDRLILHKVELDMQELALTKAILLTLENDCIWLSAQLIINL